MSHIVGFMCLTALWVGHKGLHPFLAVDRHLTSLSSHQEGRKRSNKALTEKSKSQINQWRSALKMDEGGQSRQSIPPLPMPSLSISMRFVLDLSLVCL